MVPSLCACGVFPKMDLHGMTRRAQVAGAVMVFANLDPAVTRALIDEGFVSIFATKLKHTGIPGVRHRCGRVCRHCAGASPDSLRNAVPNTARAHLTCPKSCARGLDTRCSRPSVAKPRS